MNSFYRPRCLLYLSSFQSNFFERYQNILHLLYRLLMYFEVLHVLYIWAAHGCFREIRLGQILQNRFSCLEGLVTAKCVLCQEPPPGAPTRYQQSAKHSTYCVSGTLIWSS